ncbi:PaaI family thioesterase [Streptomyces sp. ISL-36]|uniref:PaaI family thioesterase n=1 Tax=Streptomyces sp. ISL-36 TaxID=2819182 RepID=UPI001BE735FA|nr:PaaI family thioesterase [Streptomyces sp. ISL-36]MBT2443723.1 PaaI family thioesterase [Streptomyces sp. ISL-36]
MTDPSRDPSGDASRRVDLDLDLDLDLARKVLEAQPFSRLVGARITAFGGGAAVLEVDLREELRQQNGFAHGGVLSYAADNALTFAAGAALGAAVLTAGFSIQYVRPARGRTLVARAEVVHAGRRQAVVRCDLLTRDEEGAETLCAVAQGTVLSADT